MSFLFARNQRKPKKKKPPQPTGPIDEVEDETLEPRFFSLDPFYLIYGPHLELTFDVLYSNPYSLTPEANCISNRWLAHLSVNNFVVMRMSSAQSSK